MLAKLKFYIYCMPCILKLDEIFIIIYNVLSKPKLRHLQLFPFSPILIRTKVEKNRIVNFSSGRFENNCKIIFFAESVFFELKDKC